MSKILYTNATVLKFGRNPQNQFIVLYINIELVLVVCANMGISLQKPLYFKILKMALTPLFISGINI